MPRPAAQLSLLDWQAPEPVTRFEEAQVRAGSVGGRISRAVAAALRDCKLPRAEVARRMGEYLGETVSEHVLDAYASQAKEGHKISVCRLLALVHVSGDRRLLQAMADPFALAVIEARYLPLIELAATRERMDELGRQAEAARRAARAGGLL